MESERVKYIMDYYANLLNEHEKKARTHFIATAKLGPDPNPTRLKWYQERGLLVEDPLVLNLLNDGYSAFAHRAAQRILNEHPDQVFLNLCPKCQRLARTPQARQCRHCGHNWRHIITAKFQLSSSYQLGTSALYLRGNITKGEVTAGDLIDLTMIGMNQKPRITEVKKTRLKKGSSVNRSPVILATNDLSEKEKTYLINYGSHGTPFDIIVG